MKLKKSFHIILGLLFAAALIPALASVSGISFAQISPLPTSTPTPLGPAPTPTDTPVPPTNTPPPPTPTNTPPPPTPTSVRSPLAACQELIAATQLDLDGVTIGGRNAERTRISLESKLAGASKKLSESKFVGAQDKLTAFRTKVLGLANPGEPKMSQADAALLLADVDAAIKCVANLN